jgi:20S proteasome alpha/beta subunit
MTAILGLNYLDGVLLMADTEETLGGDAKSQADKLFRFNSPDGTIITGGAGDAHLIECANQELQRFFGAGAGQPPNLPLQPEHILESLNRFAGEFFEEVIAKAQGFTSGLEMLIAVNYKKQQTLLFRWNLNRVVWIPREQHTSIGAGVVQLHPLLRDLDFVGSKECMMFHGIRMMFHAKRTVAGVGGNTEVVALQNDGATHYPGTLAVQQIEELTANYEGFKKKFIDGWVSTIAATNPRIEPELEVNVASGFAGLSEQLNTYREAYKGILRPQIEMQRKAQKRRRKPRPK